MQAMQNNANEQMTEAPDTAAPADPKQKQHAPRQAREVNPVLEKLFELHPKLFGATFLPLKLGIFHDLMARHPEGFTKNKLKMARGRTPR